MTSPKQMDRMNLEKLIKKVKEYPLLYSTHHVDYAKTKLKEMAYQKIGEQMKTDGATVKECWMKLRDSHREALRRQKLKVQKGERIRQWIHQKDMEFLLPFMKIRRSIGSPARENTDEELESVDIKPLPYPYADVFTHLNYEDNNTNEEDRVEIPAKKQKTIDNTNTPQKSVANTEDNALRCFFTSMWLLTKDLPPSYQRKLRSKVLQTVSDIEESYEQDRLNTVPSSPSNPSNPL